MIILVNKNVKISLAIFFYLVNNIFMKKYDIKLFMDLMRRLTIKMAQMEKLSNEVTNTGKISFSELNLITLIGEHENINITELASIYGATKGAVSKMVKKLVLKNLVKKIRLINNEKEVLLSLTDSGIEIFKEKKHHLDLLAEEIGKHFTMLDDKQAKLFFTILESIETHIDTHLYIK